MLDPVVPARRVAYTCRTALQSRPSLARRLWRAVLQVCSIRGRTALVPARRVLVKTHLEPFPLGREEQSHAVIRNRRGHDVERAPLHAERHALRAELFPGVRDGI